MFWPKEQTSKSGTKRDATASSLAANVGSPCGDDGDSAALREGLDQHLSGSSFDVRDMANVSAARQSSL